MKFLNPGRLLAAAIAALCLAPILAAPVLAAVAQMPVVKNERGQPIPAVPTLSVDLSGAYAGGGGGGGSNASVGTTGAAVPTSATLTGGKDASGNLQGQRTDAYGGVIGGMMTGTPTRTTLTANASTALPGAGTTTRPSYFKLTVESALTANLFFCWTVSPCSATSYDEMLPSGAAAGTRLFVETPFTAAVLYFSPTGATPTVNASRPGN